MPCYPPPHYPHHSAHAIQFASPMFVYQRRPHRLWWFLIGAGTTYFFMKHREHRNYGESRVGWEWSTARAAEKEEEFEAKRRQMEAWREQAKDKAATFAEDKIDFLSGQLEGLKKMLSDRKSGPSPEDGSRI